MKIFFATMLALVLSVNVFADDAKPVASVKFAADIGAKQCASQPGKGITLSWGKVIDNRVTQAVGTFKKGKEESDVTLAGSVDSMIGDAVKTVLKNCGFTVEDKKSAGAIETTLEVTEFFAGSVKHFFTGETNAKALLVLHLKKEGSTYDFNLGATKSDKRLRMKNISQLETVLSGLLEEAVLQIPESPALFTEIKKLAGK